VEKKGVESEKITCDVNV